MIFVVFQCAKDPDYFIVTDEAHRSEVEGGLCPGGGELKPVGNYTEMGKDRAAFDETLAKNSINKQGYYRFEAPGFAPLPPSPEMP